MTEGVDKNMDNLDLSQEVGVALGAQGLTVCTAESCTGGLILSTLTDISGSSAYVIGGIVTYSNEAKMQQVNVQEKTLIDHGAVSEPTAREMAIGVRKVFDTDYALSVTGIAGPGGGTEDKPVGLTYIGVAGRDGLVAVQRHVWDSDRITNKQKSVHAALTLLLTLIQE
jgi:nicotinamide-nucleotide amidase